MPQLARLRFVRVGHRQARADDLLLDCTSEGHATDSTLWLRNGGGKSSLLSLFFTLVAPKRRQFLGAKLESGERALEEYVRVGDTGVVAAEWVLDRAPGLGDLASPPRLVTGTVLEFAEARGDEPRDLQRAFFCCRTVPGVLATTLNGLPLTTVTGQRHTLKGLRTAWQGIRQATPEAQVVWTERLQEWNETLESVGLDPRLFEAQALMNQGEGEAERLFTQFRTSDDYVRFFLELLAPPELATPIVTNLTTHREALRARQTQLLPEGDLVAGLRTRLAPLAGVHADRTAHGDVLARALGEAQALDAALLALHARATEEHTNAAQSVLDCAGEARIHRTESQTAAREAAWCHLWLARQEMEAADRERQTAEFDYKGAVRAQKLWGAALTLRTIRRHEATVATLDAQIAERVAEHRPLLEQVEAAGFRYAQALAARREAATAAMAEADQRLTGAQAAEQTARDDETEAQKAATAAQAAAGEARRRLQEAQRELERLVRQGDCQPEEPVPDAMARQQRLLEAAQADRAQAVRDREQAVERRVTATASGKQARQAVGQARAALATAVKALADARAAKDALERDPDLARLLDVDQGALDLRALDARSVARLQHVAGEAQRRLLAGHVDLSTETRALDHLRAHGVLPPSSTVEHLLARVQEHVPQVWDGWRYLALMFPLDVARALVERAPAVATGLVVRDEDFPTAQAVLGPLGADLDDPVLVVPASAVTAEGLTAVGTTVGPGDDAHLSGTAGRAALERRGTRHTEHQKAQALEEQTRMSAERCATRLDAWLREYGPTWWPAAEGAEAAAKTELAQAESAVVEADAALADTDAAMHDAESRRDAAVKRETGARLALDHLKTWHRQHPEGLAGYRAREQQAEAERQAAQQAVASAKERQRVARADRDDAQRRRQDEIRRRDDAIRDTDLIRHLPGNTPVTPLAGDTVALGAAYEDGLRHYHQAVGVDALEHQREMARREVRAQRGTLDKQCRADITIAEVETEYATLLDPDDIETRQADADERHKSAFGRHGNASQLLARTQDRHREAEEAWHAAGGLDLGTPPEPSTPEEATARMQVARQREQQALKAADETEQLGVLAQETAIEAARRAERAEDSRTHLAGPLNGLATLASSVGRVAMPAATPTLDEGAVRRELQRLTRCRESEDTALRALDVLRDRHVQAVFAWCDEPAFAGLQASVGPRIKRYTTVELERRSTELTAELTLRADTIAADLAATEQDRDLLIQSALGAAHDGARLLVKLATSSTIPETVPVLGRRALLQCKLQAPELEAEGRVRIGALLDSYVTADTLPGPTKFLQEAVLRLAGPITVKILRPSMETVPVYEPITTLGKFSGGEKLTVATLLYCALATTRARTVGRRVEPSGVLLMDNPFGKASRASFITLQREVARRLGIQLVYLTGINDFEALRCFPNVVRLENARFDRATGERVVEVGDAAETEALLSAARIARRDVRGQGPVVEGAA